MKSEASQDKMISRDQKFARAWYTQLLARTGGDSMVTEYLWREAFIPQ